ncbi:MAG: DUF1016 family protein [Oscillospiraceae bacterium]|nr:DUF1016 family protein [Oscillospiraceae bacterium]
MSRTTMFVQRMVTEKEAVNSNWSVREMKRQINTSLYERLLLSKGEFNKEQVLSLAANGIEIAEPADIIKDPYVFEFLGIPEDKPIGIILCTDKDALTAEYALGGLSSNIFASKYTYYIPQKEQLIAEVEKVINRWHENNK